jgi:hypothetical protein
MNDEDAKVAELWARVVELEKKAQLCLEDWNGEDWLDFARAATEISDKLAIPLGPAEAQLRELCGSGKIRAITLPLDVNEAPQFIPPSRWWREDVDFKTVLAVSYSDLLYWLDQQPTPKPTPERTPERGKVPLIIDHLKEMFPDGVPDPSRCPRKKLRADLLAKDKSLAPLDEATLKRAIDLIRNDPN